MQFPVLARAELEKGIPQFSASLFLFFIFPCVTTKKGWQGIKKSWRGEGIIPFTTCSVQGQAASEGGGYTGKK